MHACACIRRRAYARARAYVRACVCVRVCVCVCVRRCVRLFMRMHVSVWFQRVYAFFLCADYCVCLHRNT